MARRGSNFCASRSNPVPVPPVDYFFLRLPLRREPLIRAAPPGRASHSRSCPPAPAEQPTSNLQRLLAPALCQMAPISATSHHLLPLHPSLLFPFLPLPSHTLRPPTGTPYKKRLRPPDVHRRLSLLIHRHLFRLSARRCEKNKVLRTTPVEPPLVSKKLVAGQKLQPRFVSSQLIPIFFGLDRSS
jgi:hypothetical protein